MRRCILRNASFAILLLIVNSSAFAEREDHGSRIYGITEVYLRTAFGD